MITVVKSIVMGVVNSKQSIPDEGVWGAVRRITVTVTALYVKYFCLDLSYFSLYHVLHYLAGKLHMVRGLQLLLLPAQATHVFFTPLHFSQHS